MTTIRSLTTSKKGNTKLCSAVLYDAYFNTSEGTAFWSRELDVRKKTLHKKVINSTPTVDGSASFARIVCKTSSTRQI